MIAEVLQFFRGEDGDAQISEVKGDLGGNDIITAVNYQPHGFDSVPLGTTCSWFLAPKRGPSWWLGTWTPRTPARRERAT